MSRSPEPLRVLVTGGTRGLGRALCEEFASRGGRVVATYHWDTDAADRLAKDFAVRGWPEPLVIEADASDPEHNRDAMKRIRDELGGLDALISNVAFGQLAGSPLALKRKSLELSLGYSTWPIVDLLQASREVLEGLPRYALAISSDGPDVCHPGYDQVAVCKSALETLCRYLALQLKGHAVRVNVIRPGFLDTDSSRTSFGDDALKKIAERFPDMFLDPRAVARVAVALCSGLMDSVTGQVLTVDEGWSLVSPITYLSDLGAPEPFPPEVEESG